MPRLILPETYPHLRKDDPAYVGLAAPFGSLPLRARRALRASYRSARASAGSACGTRTLTLRHDVRLCPPLV